MTTKKAYPFALQRRAGIWVVFGKYWVRPASDVEVRLWSRLQRYKRQVVAKQRERV